MDFQELFDIVSPVHDVLCSLLIAYIFLQALRRENGGNNDN